MIITHSYIFPVTGGFRGGGGAGGGSQTSCETHECRLRAGLFGVGFIGAVFCFWILLYACQSCYSYCQNRSDQNNTNFVHSTDHKIVKQEAYDDNPFQSGIWSSQYFQYNRWHGPHQFRLSFKCHSMKVTGSGSDDVGVFTIDGIYSTETNQIDLKKTYELGTGDRSENLRHPVTIQLTWNTENRQFEGKWYVEQSKHHDDDEFVLKFYRASIQSKLFSIFKSV
jgi:hypothetical protein